jgi:hypothetical protein
MGCYKWGEAGKDLTYDVAEMTMWMVVYLAQLVEMMVFESFDEELLFSVPSDQPVGPSKRRLCRCS